MNCILVADSGSTKTDWILISGENNALEVHTAGLNPVRDSQSVIFSIFSEELLPQLPSLIIQDIYFYGAGCILPFSKVIQEALAKFFPKTPHISVESDLLGAARALCGHNEGIACILGTGSNSCYYDGQTIRQNTPPLGYILGDEGSGSVLGKTFAGQLLKGLFPETLSQQFFQETGLTQLDILNKVYREPRPNAFLASFVPFIAAHRQEEGIHRLIIENFRLFLTRNITPYHRSDLPICFVGSIADVFQDELTEALNLEGFKKGEILRKPIKKIVKFHCS